MEGMPQGGWWGRVRSACALGEHAALHTLPCLQPGNSRNLSFGGFMEASLQVKSLVVGPWLQLVQPPVPHPSLEGWWVGRAGPGQAGTESSQSLIAWWCPPAPTSPVLWSKSCFINIPKDLYHSHHLENPRVLGGALCQTWGQNLNIYLFLQFIASEGLMCFSSKWSGILHWGSGILSLF